ncbi:hypothetical protein VPMS16_2348 [Vibrio sp. 16]|nr:hypothetical protein VPMS16_2348 [Vibrio sp. 16]
MSNCDITRFSRGFVLGFFVSGEMNQALSDMFEVIDCYDLSVC